MSPAARAGVVVAGVFGLGVVVVAVLFVVARQTTSPLTPRPAVTVTTSAPTDTGTTATTPAATPSASTSPSPTSDPQAVAQAALVASRQQTLQSLSLNGRWVLQLSSKADGMVDPLQTAANGTHTFHYADIQAQFDELSAQVRGAAMLPMVLTAADFGTKPTPKGDQMWVLLADPGYVGSKEVAQAACQRLFPRLSGTALSNACLPRTLVPPT